MNKIIYILLAGISAATSLQAQEKWGLQKCVEYAWQNSLTIKRAEITEQQNKLQHKQAYWAQFPTANANIQQGFNSGRSIDMTSYQFVNQFMTSTSYSLSLSAPIYNGGQIRGNISRTEINTQAAHQDVLQAKNDLALSIAQAFLSVLLAEENLDVLKQQILVTQSQYDRTQRLIDAGALPDNARFDLEAQLARDEQNIVNAENSVATAYLNLKVLMNMNASTPLVAERVVIQSLLPRDTTAAAQVYAEALDKQPKVAAARLREKSAEVSVRVAKGALQPTLSAFASLATNYSSTGRYYTGDTMMINQTISGSASGVPFTLTIPQSVPVSEPSSYPRQLWTNFRQSFGVSLQVPIFNGFQARINVQQSELSVKLAQLNTKQVEIQLQSDIQQAVTNLKAAEKRLAAAEKSLRSTEAAAENSRKRFELGIVNSFEYISVQNTLISAKSNLLQAKYDYLFKQKIVDFYRGKAIELN